MNTYSSFNELVAAQSHNPQCSTQMSIFNAINSDFKSRLDSLRPSYDVFCKEGEKLKIMIDDVVSKASRSKGTARDFDWETHASPKIKTQLAKIEKIQGEIDNQIATIGEWYKKGDAHMSSKDAYDTFYAWGKESNDKYLPIREAYADKIPSKAVMYSLWFAVKDGVFK